jgi:hypothetical protein
MSKLKSRDMFGVVGAIFTGICIYCAAFYLGWNFLNTEGWNKVIVIIAQVGIPVVFAVFGALFYWLTIQKRDNKR